MQNKQSLLWVVMSASLLLFNYEAYAKRGGMGGGGHNKTDTKPNQFSFIDQTNVTINSLINSNVITITGINAATSVSISGGEYSLDGGGSFTASSGSLLNNQAVIVRTQSSGSYLSSTGATLNVGGVSDIFTVTTLDNPADTTPDNFSFTDQVDIALNDVVYSNSITVGGINAATSVNVIGGEYAVNGGTFSSVAANVNNADSVQVRVNASVDYAVVSNVTLTIGGISDTFSVLTVNSPVIEPGATGNPSFVSEHFSGSANCQMCHDGLTDNTGKDVSINKAWQSTMMANATRDPLWKAKVRTELNRTPSLAGVINSKCSKCHAPMAHVEASRDSATIEILDGGFTNPNNDYHDRAMDGVSCTLCHQIKDSQNLGTLAGMSGHYEIDSYANAVDRKIYGPYSNVMTNPMRMNVSYTPEYSAHIKDSELCATCHNLKTPYTDDAGNILSTTPESEFPEQMPYSEWLASDYASTQSCQQCHMARANGVKISNRPMRLGARDDFAEHIFVGGNRFMLDILNNNKEELGVLANDFSKIITATENLLANAASIEVLGTAQTVDSLEFSVRVSSSTGHKLPSAYPSRRVILHVTVKDSAGATVFESGKVNADGSVDGLDSDINQATYEPHYEVITLASQVQAYEAIMQDYKGDVTYTLLRGSAYAKDNRLLPIGFDKQTAPNDVKVAGDAFTDSNFIGGSDEISYSLAGLTGDDYTVTVELLYQTLAYGFAQDLFQDTAKEVTDFKRMYDASNAKVTTITSETFIVTP
ncbi:MAG: hypothetical protein GQ581_05895 [Methyloprofundus sp.]|nr:hypothetical protein [Methyloprofundus sp.]